MNATDRKARLEALMSTLIGKPVCLTVRGPKSFTFSTDDVTARIGEAVAGFFGALATVTTDHDAECGSFAYVEVA
jgi:hypothetical protein